MQGDDRILVLERGQRNEDNAETGEKTLSRFEVYRALAGERVTSTTDQLPPNARSTLELLSQPQPRYQGELVWRLGLVLGGANMLLLGIGLAATNPRRLSNWNLLFALLAFVVYFNLINLSKAWVASSRMGMGAALLGIHGSAFLLAIGLIWWREQGRARMRPRAPAGTAAG